MRWLFLFLFVLGVVVGCGGASSALDPLGADAMGGSVDAAPEMATGYGDVKQKPSTEAGPGQLKPLDGGGEAYVDATADAGLTDAASSDAPAEASFDAAPDAGADACQPASCDGMCGTTADGCGGLRNCGECPGGDAGNVICVANLCSALTTPTCAPLNANCADAAPSNLKYADYCVCVTHRSQSDACFGCPVAPGNPWVSCPIVQVMSSGYYACQSF